MDLNISMGCGPSKELKTNLRSDDPNQVIGSTMLRADQIVVLGDSVFLPTQNPDGESTIIEISINDKKMSVYRGYQNKLVRSGIT
jgi:hypothetical protein